jgi:hypothetical protein
MRHGRDLAPLARSAGARRSANSQRPVAKQLGGSTPAAKTPHRGALLAFDAMEGIGRRKLPGSIRPLDSIARKSSKCR